MTTLETPVSQLMSGVIPYVAVRGAEEAIAFYKRAFGAIQRGEIHRDPNGHVMHATLEVNGGALMLLDEAAVCADPMPTGNHAFTLQLVVLEGEAMWNQAVEAGCTVTMPFAPQFWGDRYGRLTDPFGIDWAINEPSAENRAIHS